jgi:hypothetical protein
VDAAAPSASRPVLLASVDGDAHVLPLYVLAALLTEADIRVRLLGASTPLAALRAAAVRLRPGAIFLWSMMSGPMNGEFVRGVAEFGQGVSLVLGGPGWQDLDLPDGVTRVNTLEDALACLST